jgi:hypothetical protein
MGRMLMAERRHFAVFGVLPLRNAVAVVGDIAAAAAAAVGVVVVVVAADVAGPFPVESVGVKVMRRANGGSRCLRTEAWQWAPKQEAAQ